MPEKSLPNAYELLRASVLTELKQVDSIILELAQSKIDLIPEMVNHLMQSGGKRIRPILTLACAKMVGCENPEVVKLAAAVEFIHTATLFHDDVIDETPIRRGKKTANNIWGNKASILVGDFLLSHAFKLMTDTGSIKALSLLSDTAIEITESEVWQLDLIGKTNITIDSYINLIHGKTASLFATSCAVGSYLMDDGDKYYESLYNAGLALGILFQISDDYLDYYASSSSFGKAIGSDFREKKVTLPLILLLQEVSSDERSVIEDNMGLENPDIKLIINLMTKYGVQAKAMQIANKYSDDAKDFLKKIAK